MDTLFFIYTPYENPFRTSLRKLSDSDKIYNKMYFLLYLIIKSVFFRIFSRFLL